MKKIILYSHTHWDREWYLSQKQFQYQLGDVFDEIVDTLENDADFHAFVADGQTVVIDDYLELRPHRIKAVERLIQTGKLIIGPWYTMPDLWLADGEALIRNLLYGACECKKYGIKQPNTGYVPDSFGHIEQMPAILNGFGIDNYIFTRGTPIDSIDGRLEFIWNAPDGKSRVTAHILPGNYGNARMLEGIENLEGLICELKTIADMYAERSVNAELSLGCNGTDHVWVQRDLPLILETARQCLPEYEIIHGTLEDYIREFDKKTYDLPQRSGILLSSHLNSGLLHGTWSSRIDNKIDNYRVTHEVQSMVEPLNTLSVLMGGKNSKRELELCWRWILQNHAHDSICGCSQDRVHADVERRFAHAEELAEMITGDILKAAAHDALTEKRPELIRYAGLAGDDGLTEFAVEFDGEAEFHLEDRAGRHYPVQVIKQTRLFRQDLVRYNGQYQDKSHFERYYNEYHAVAALPHAEPCSIERLRICEGAVAVQGGVRCGEHFMENQRLAVTFNPNGTIDVLHKKSGRRYTQLLKLTDEEELGGGYEHYQLQEGHQVQDTEHCVAVCRITQRGPLRGCAEVSYEWAVPAGLNESRNIRRGEKVNCTVQFTFTLDDDSETLQIRLLFTNRANDHRVRLALHNAYDRCDRAFCRRAFVVAKEDMARYSWDEGQNQLPMHGWCATDGMAFWGAGLHEFSVSDGNMEITLLRSVPFTFESGTWATPDAQLHKELCFDCALLFYSGSYLDGEIPARAAQLDYPSVAEVFGACAPEWIVHPYASNYLGEVRGEEVIPTDMLRSVWRHVYAHRDGWRRFEPARLANLHCPERLSPITITGKHILLSAFKLAEDAEQDVVLRLYSLADEEQKISVQASFVNEGVFRANMAEEPLEEICMEGLHIVPYEIITLRIKNAWFMH